MASAIEAVYLVEASPSLREAQHKLLCGGQKLEETDIGHQSYSKYSPELKIIWCEDVRLLPKGKSNRPDHTMSSTYMLQKLIKHLSLLHMNSSMLFLYTSFKASRRVRLSPQQSTLQRGQSQQRVHQGRRKQINGES